MDRKLPSHFLRFRQEHPDVHEAFEALGKCVHDAGPLSPRERRLVKLGIAIGVNAEGAVHSALRQAEAGGCTAEDLEHVVMLAITTLGWPRAMAAMSWVYDALDDGDEDEEPAQD
jgi:alkylhydroperoxidase/carboxymuconolactone decarboxylase family protein YurZ